MPRFFHVKRNQKNAPSFSTLWRSTEQIMPDAPIIRSRGDRPLQMNFEDQLKALVFFHLEEHQ